MPDFTPDEYDKIAGFVSQPANTDVGRGANILANAARGFGEGIALPAQALNALLGEKEQAEALGRVRQQLAESQPGDLAPTNPNYDTGIPETFARAFGSALPLAATFEVSGPLGLGLGALGTQQATADRQAARQAQIDAGIEPTEPEVSPWWEQAKGAATLGAFGAIGRVVPPLTNPVLAAITPALRPIAGIGAHGASNFAIDALLRTGEHALEGKPLSPFATPQEAAASAGGGLAFGLGGGIHQAGAIPAWIKNRDLARAKQLQADAIAKAAETQTVSPNTPPPDNIEVKPATEESTGIAIEPAKQADPVTPTTALPHEVQLNPNAAALVDQTSTKEPQVVVTPKKESTETKAEPATPTVLEPADRLKVIDEEMEKIREESGVGDDGQLSIASPETQATFDALAAERMKLALGEEPTKGPQPVTGLERPKAENAPPPFTSEEAAPEVAFPETQKAPKVTQADVTEVVKPEEQVRAESDLTKLSDDELETQESIARQTNDQSTLDRIDTEIARRAALGETPIAEERPAGVPDNVAENAQRGAGVPGDAAVAGERGQEPVPGLTPEEAKELDALWKKPKATRTDLDRIDELQGKIPAPPVVDNWNGEAKSDASLLIRRGRANAHQALARIAESNSKFADVAKYLHGKFGDILSGAKIIFEPDLVNAHYDPVVHTIHLGEAHLSDTTIMHEIVHGFTATAVDNAILKSNPGLKADVKRDAYFRAIRKTQSDPNTPQPIKDLIGSYFHAIKVLGVGEQAKKVANQPDAFTGKEGVPYGFTTLHELMSEAFTNVKFQNVLNRIKDPRGGTVWTRLVDAVRRVLGMKVDQTSLLASVIKHADQIGEINTRESDAITPAKPSTQNEEERPYIDRGQPPVEPLPPDYQQGPHDFTAYKELPRGTSGSAIDQAPEGRRLLFENRGEGDNRSADERNTRGLEAAGDDGQHAAPSRGPVAKAFEAIKNLPFVKKVADSSIAKRIKERLDPVVQDLRESIEAKFRGMEFLKSNAATQARKGIAIAFSHNKEDMAAAYPLLEAGAGRIGEPDGPTAQDVRLEVQLQLNNGRKALESPVVSNEAKEVIKKFLPAYERALEKFDDLAPKTKRVKEAFDDAYKLRASLDPDARYTDDYVSRIYELNKLRGDSPLPPESLIGGGKSGITSFDKSRKYDTIMDAMIGRKTESGTWESETPKSFDVSDLAANHTAVSNDIVSNKLLQDNFETTSYPGTNEPLFVPKPKVGESLPPNYVRIDGPFKQPVFVYHAVADLFKSIYGESQLRNSDAGNILLKASGAIKHGTLALDTFHLSRVIQKSFMEAVASGDWQKVADFKKNMPSYTEQGEMGKYLGTLDIAPKDVDAAIKAGELTPEAGSWVKGEGQVLKNRAESGGLLAGRFTDNLWKDAEKFLKTAFDTIHLPKGFEKLEQFNKFTFERVTKSAMLSAFESRLKRIDKDFPELTEHQRNIRAAKEVNEQFGNIGRSGLLKSKTAQDYAQLFMLAPNWVQSQVMAEARQYGQGARALFDATVGKKLPNGERERVFRVGNSARFLATTALSVFAANQVVNLATRGKPTWENEEEGHKFDAWIPGGKDGFFYSPIALASEYAHHLHNYGQYESLPSAVAHIASNKLSPLAGAAKVALTQKDYTGKKLTPGETVVATARQALPIPILASSALKGVDSASKAGTTQQNLLRSAGISTDRAPDAVAQGYQKFAPYRTKDRPDTGPSDYKNLKTLVQNGETPDKIKAEVDRLQKAGKKLPDIRRSFDFKNLAGSLANDMKAIKEKPELAKVRAAAIAQKKAEADAFRKALQSK